MKLLLLFIVILFTACATERIEVGFERVELVKIDTVYRFGEDKIRLTLLSQSRVEYVSFASIKDRFILGTKYLMFTKK